MAVSQSKETTLDTKHGLVLASLCHKEALVTCSWPVYFKVTYHLDKKCAIVENWAGSRVASSVLGKKNKSTNGYEMNVSVNWLRNVLRYSESWTYFVHISPVDDFRYLVTRNSSANKYNQLAKT